MTTSNGPQPIGPLVDRACRPSGRSGSRSKADGSRSSRSTPRLMRRTCSKARTATPSASASGPICSTARSTRLAEFAADVELKAKAADPLLFRHYRQRVGPRRRVMQSLMRIDPPNRVIEVGGIMYTPAMQRTPGATEAQYLFARYVFDELGYRRYEWKCNALNAPSRRAAERFGFTFEGIFRQHMIVKGRNRDTAWFAMLDSEWPARKAAYERWLKPDNFDDEGRQKTRLSDLMPRTADDVHHSRQRAGVSRRCTPRPGAS